jgi:phosphoribosylformylglycinamidine synthase
MLWEIELHPAPGQPKVLAARVRADLLELWPDDRRLQDEDVVTAAHGFLLQGDLDEASVRRLAHDLLSDVLVETAVVHPAVGPADYKPRRLPQVVREVHVLPKPGVMDPVAESAVAASHGLGLPVEAVRTMRK